MKQLRVCTVLLVKYEEHYWISSRPEIRYTRKHAVYWFYGGNENEAIGNSINLCFKEYPGYCIESVNVTEIPGFITKQEMEDTLNKLTKELSEGTSVMKNTI